MNRRATPPIITPCAADRQSAWRVAAEAVQKARAHEAGIRSGFHDILCLGRLISAWAVGEYTRVPWRTIATASGALVYFLNPLDLIPDAIVAAGYLDDMAVIGVVVSSMRNDLERFRRWEARRRGARARSGRAVRAHVDANR